MAETKHQHSDSPPQKYRDPNLVGRSKEELSQTREKYVGETLAAAAREALRHGTMAPAKLQVGTEGKKRISELQERLLIEEKELLNMAFAYAYTEASQKQVSTDELRSRIQSIQLDEEYTYFEINESVLSILCQSNAQDAQFIFLYAGLDLLYSRLIRRDETQSKGSSGNTVIR